MTMDESLLGCRDCYLLRKEYETRELETRRNYTILKQMITSNENVFLKLNQMQSMQRLIDKMHLELSQREKQVADYMQEYDSFKKVVDRLELSLKTKTDDLDNLTEKQKIRDAVMQQLQAALKDKEKEFEQQKTLIRQLKTQNTKNTKNNKAKAKDKDTEQSKLIISSLLKLALYFAQTLEQRGLLEPKSSAKVKRLFSNPKSILEVLKSNFNGCSRDLQEIFVITKVDETEHENGSSFEEDDEDGILLQELLTADDTCIVPIKSPRPPDKCAIKSPQKTPPMKLNRNSPPEKLIRNSPPEKLIRNSPPEILIQNSPPEKLIRNSPPEILIQNSPREKLIRNSPPEILIQNSPREKLIRNSSPRKLIESSPFKTPSKILTRELPTKSPQTSRSNGLHLESLTNNFYQKPLLQNSSWKSPTKNSLAETLEEERDEATEFKNTTPSKIPLAENIPCVRKSEPICNGNTNSSLLNGTQRLEEKDCAFNQINVRKRRREDEGKVRAKISEIFSAMIFRERPVSPIPKKLKRSFENNCVDAENCLPELEPPKPKVQTKSSTFISNLKPRCSSRIRPVTKVYVSNKESILVDETKAQVCETPTDPPCTAEDHLSQLREKETSSTMTDGDDGAINSEKMGEFVANFASDENVLDSKAAQDENATLLQNNDLEIERTSSLKDSPEIKDEFSGGDSPEIKDEFSGGDSPEIKDEFSGGDSPEIKDEFSGGDSPKTNCSASSESSQMEVDSGMTEDLDTTNLPASNLKDDEQLAEDKKAAESNETSEMPLDLSLAKPTVELSCSSDLKGNNLPDVPDVVSILLDSETLVENKISHEAECNGCSPMEITENGKSTDTENLELEFANDETISVILDSQKQPESDGAESNKMRETVDIVCQADVAVLIAEDSASFVKEEEKQPDRSSATSDNVQASNGLSLSCEWTENSCLPTVVDFDDNDSLLSSPECHALIIDERIERTPDGSRPTLSNEIESPESPTAEIPTCFDIPVIPLSPPHARYWTRSRTNGNNSNNKPSPDINSSQNNCLGKDVTNIGNKDELVQNASPNGAAVSPLMTPISPLPTTPVRIKEIKSERDLSRECVEPRPPVRRQIVLNGNCNEDLATKKQKSGMEVRKKAKREVKAKQFAITNVKSEHRMCTRSSTRNENEQVRGTKSKQAEELKRKEAQDKKNKQQSRNKSRARRDKFQKMANVEISAAEKCLLKIPMHLMFLIRNVITELKECRLDLTSKLCDSTRNRDVLVLTDEEKILLERVKEKTKKISVIAKKRAFDTLYESLNAAIFTDSSIHTFGRASLCRFYCAICKYLGNLDQIKALCYNLLLKMTDVAGFFIINVLDELPASSQLYEVIQYVLVNCDIGLTSSMKTYIASMFSEVFCTKACDIYLSDLLIKLRESDEVSEIEWSVEIIAAVKGWSWAKENLVLKYLWPTITEWREIAKKSKNDGRNNSHLSDTFVASIFRILGPVCQKCPSAESHMIIGFMKELRLLLQTVNLNLVTSVVQEGVIEAIINLEKFRPDIPRMVLKFWLSTTKHVISPHLQTMIDQVAKKMNVDSAELVEGWT